MKALILVGGLGTRLRPMTVNIPKPLIPFCGRPMVEWQIKAFAEVGIKTIILAIGYKKELMEDFISKMVTKYKVTIECSVEEIPLGTGGPIRLAEKFLKKDDELFFLANSDIICKYPL